MFLKLVLWVFFPFSRFQWHPSSSLRCSSALTAITASTLQVPLLPRAHWWQWGWGSSLQCPGRWAQPRDSDSHQGRATGGMAVTERHWDISLTHRTARAAKVTSCRTTTRIRRIRGQWAFSSPPPHSSSIILHPMEPFQPLKLLACLTPAPKLLQ